jgi:3-oxoacid CoA-transferase subunit B
VDVLITDLAVFERADRKQRFRLIELAPGVLSEKVRALTEADYDDSFTMRAPS